MSLRAYAACVMRSSTYVEDVDFKGLEFCYTCRRQLHDKLDEFAPRISK